METGTTEPLQWYPVTDQLASYLDDNTFDEFLTLYFFIIDTSLFECIVSGRVCIIYNSLSIPSNAHSTSTPIVF